MFSEKRPIRRHRQISHKSVKSVGIDLIFLGMFLLTNQTCQFLKTTGKQNMFSEKRRIRRHRQISHKSVKSDGIDLFFFLQVFIGKTINPAKFYKNRLIRNVFSEKRRL